MAALNFDLVGVNNYEILQHILYTKNIKTMLEPKHYAYLEKISLYLSKMVMFDVELVGVYDYSILATACLYVAFKIIEQVDPLFKSD
jgi:cyclin A